MEAITYTNARQNLAKTIPTRSADDHGFAGHSVTRKSSNSGWFIMSLEDYQERWNETADTYSRSPKRHMRRLLESHAPKSKAAKEAERRNRRVKLIFRRESPAWDDYCIGRRPTKKCLRRIKGV